MLSKKKEKVVCEVKYLYSDNFSLRFKYAIQYCTEGKRGYQDYLEWFVLKMWNKFDKRECY